MPRTPVKPENPVAFNPATMRLAHVIEAAETLRTIFGLAMNEDVSNATLGATVRSMLKGAQDKARRGL